MSEMYLYSNEYKYYIVYKTTNLKNNKFYIGVHAQNEDPQTFDGYLGSGDVIKQAIRKYGRSSFQRETVAWYDNYQDAYDHEAKLVTEEFLVENKGLNYNQRPGGSGGFGMYNRNRVTMHKGDVEIKVKQDEVESHLAEGWSFGRPVKTSVTVGQTQKKMKMEECLATFNVQTEEELRELFTELYMTQNLSLEQISMKYNCKQSLCKYIQRKFELTKDRKARSATRKDSKSKK